VYYAGFPADEGLRILETCMRSYSRFLVLLCVIFSGCGSNLGDAPAAAIGFVNETQHSDAQLWSLWKTAQQSLSQQIDLNPLQRQLSNAAPDILPGDPRALKVSPHQLVVAPQADVSAAALYAATGTQRSDPTGLIQCPQPCNVNYAPAYSRYVQPASRYAASWEFSGNNFDTLVEYEFENHILEALGYDLRWR
jgi:hypothetical protein